MFLKKTIFPVVLFSLLLAGGVSVYAQTTQVSGRVVIKQEDGSLKPVEGAKVDCYRTDSNLRCRSTNTNSRGEFTFLGIPYNGTVALAVSGEGIAGLVFPNAKAGQDDVEIEVYAGDGQELDEETVRKQVELFAANPTGELTEDQKKAQEEYEKQVAEIEAKNKKIEEKNALIERVLKEGNAAYEQANYDLAIAKYEEGVEADPEFVGSAPVLLNNKGAALKKRAVDVYNAGAKTGDGRLIAEAKGKAGSDLAESLKAYHRAFTILNSAAPTAITNPAKHKSDIFRSLNEGRDAIRIMVLIKTVDGNLTAEATTITEEFLEEESDKAKHAEAQANLAAYLFEGGDFDGSVEAYRKAYNMAPKDPDVLAKFSLALYTVAEDKGDAALKQESLNYMDAYLKSAPQDHKLRADIAGLADYLQTSEKMKPQKIN